jgi:hypothetical protein
MKINQYIILILVGLIVGMGAVSAENLQKQYNNGPGNEVDVEIWVDNEDGIYYEGEDITVFFQADRNCYVAIYSIDTQGDVSLLYPPNPWDNGSIIGGEVYTIPGRYDDYNLVVSGPEGIEYVEVIASEEPLDIPDWYNGSSVNCDYNDDRDEFIDFINERYFNCRRHVCPRGFDQVLIYVKAPRYYYQPVYIPHHWYDYPDYAVIYIDYPFGGEVFIDGIFIGYAPLWVPRCLIGYRWFTIYDRYGYCWESHIYVSHSQNLYLDRSRVKTSRSVISRFKDVRVQTSKYSRTSVVKSDQRVKSVRSDNYKKTGRTYDSWSSSKRSTRGYKGTASSKSSRGSYKGSGSKKESEKSYRGSSSAKRSISGNKGSISDRKSSGSRKSTGTARKSTGSYRKGSTSSGSSSSGKKSSGTVKQSTGGSKKSGSSQKSSGSSKSGSSSRSSGSKKR